MSKDIPVVHLQLTLFADASIVGLTTPHVLCDGHGNKEIAQALALILNGGSPPPLPEGDPFRPYSPSMSTASYTTPQRWKVFSSLQIVVFLFWLLWDFAWNRDIENRELYIPAEEAAKIKAQATRELRDARGYGEDVWISTSDALLAFVLKVNDPQGRP
jgi:hypothetical protein